MSACVSAACNRRLYAKGYCKKHYTQVQRHGRLTPETERGIDRRCMAPGCSKHATHHGYCLRHTRQIAKHGRLTPEREHHFHVGCSVSGCERPHRAKGLCVKHYNHERWLYIASVLREARERGRA